MQIYAQAVTEAKRAANAKVTTMIVPISSAAPQAANGPLTDPRKPQICPSFDQPKEAVNI